MAWLPADSDSSVPKPSSWLPREGVAFFLLWIISPCIAAAATNYLLNVLIAFGCNSHWRFIVAWFLFFGVFPGLLAAWQAWLLFGFRRRFWFWITAPFAWAVLGLWEWQTGRSGTERDWFGVGDVVALLQLALLFGVRRRPWLGVVSYVVISLAEAPMDWVRDHVSELLAMLQATTGIGLPVYFTDVGQNSMSQIGIVFLGVLLSWAMPPKESLPGAASEPSPEPATV